MNECTQVDIALALYNGERWLPDFLASLLAQTHRPWRLIVADDGSTDGSKAVLQRYFMDDPQRFVLLERAHVRTGPARAFGDALVQCSAPYIALADQDDVWLPRKLEVLIAALRSAQDADVPCLAYSDMEVVDEDLNAISASWWHHSNTPPDWSLCLRHSVCQNTVPGCAMMINQALLRCAMPVPADAAMHDWWLLLVALANGQVKRSDEALLRYRRHSGAATYQYGNSPAASLRRFLFGRNQLRIEYARSIGQARALASRLAGQISPDNAETLRGYIASDTGGWLSKRLALLKGRFRKSTWLGCLRFYTCV